MNDVIARATALKELLESGAHAEATQPVAEAIVGCCEQLIDAGEPALALSLIGSSSILSQGAGDDYRLRLAVLRARALQVSRKNEESLTLVRSLLAEERSLLEARPKEAYKLRICEATNFWQ